MFFITYYKKTINVMNLKRYSREDNGSSLCWASKYLQRYSFFTVQPVSFILKFLNFGNFFRKFLIFGIFWKFLKISFFRRKSTLYGWSSDGTLRAYKIDFKEFWNNETNINSKQLPIKLISIYFWSLLALQRKLKFACKLLADCL